jgi:DNA-binding HxlR family transcriptional regulator
MYERKIPEDLDCGINISMKVFGAKWKPCIIDAINRGFLRPSELHKEITSATPRVIDMQLRELEEYRVVYKKVYPGVPLKVEYRLTELGQSILPVIAQLEEWGNTNRSKVLDPAALTSLESNTGADPCARTYPGYIAAATGYENAGA